MQTVKGMAEAHLNSVQKTISDLEQQKFAIDEEISKTEKLSNRSYRQNV